MNSLPFYRNNHLYSRRQHRPKKAAKRARAAHGKPFPPTPSPSYSSAIDAIPKPMRPLTAYHIFFQLERELIIQSAAGPGDADCIHAGKSYLYDVPGRYRAVKLLPDWYAGPGKRRKRRHRRQHGKIGFLELSRVVSGRWATLGETDPETKRYVAGVAARELAGYKEEMREYEALVGEAVRAAAPAADPLGSPPRIGTEGVPSSRVGMRRCDAPIGTTMSAVAPGAPAARPAAARWVTATAGVISPSSSPRFGPDEVPSSRAPPTSAQYQQPLPPMPSLSLQRDFAMSAVSTNEDEVDYSICDINNNGHYVPSPGPIHSNAINVIHPAGTICDPLFELDEQDGVQPLFHSNDGNRFHLCDPLFELKVGHGNIRNANRRCVSPASMDGMVGDADFLRLT